MLRVCGYFVALLALLTFESLVLGGRGAAVLVASMVISTICFCAAIRSAARQKTNDTIRIDLLLIVAAVGFVVTFVVYFTTAVYHMSMDLPLLCIFATLSALFGWAYSATLTMLQGALQVEVAHPKARLPRRPF